MRGLLFLALTIAADSPASATYSNGQAFSQSLDVRRKIDELKVTKSAAPASTPVWLTYAYDARGKLSSIVDADGAGDNEGCSFAYDPNGRLLTATSPWNGTASYVYDALGNLRTRSEGTGSLSTMSYDATNRVSSAVIFGQNRTVSYDARGNTANNGDFAFAYDFANQPVSQTGAINASFAYDANLKRVKEVRGTKTIYTIYSRLTGGAATAVAFST
jgi:uncharacterized protein RhaS with RHS repeats